MARPNSGSIDQAIIGVLQADATLAGLMPDGVYFNLAPPGRTRFVLVGLIDDYDESVFGQARALEHPLYFAKAVGLARATSLSTVKAAADRIDQLLESATLAPADYAEISCTREERAPADTVPDPLDPSLSWFHFGGHYRVQAAWPDPPPHGVKRYEH